MTRGGATRFRSGQSGNPKGRPRKAASQQSAFDIVIDRTLTVTQNGVERELTIDEALQQRTYQDAIGGSRSARREVLKMIAKREKWIAAHAPVPKPPPFDLRMEHDPDNAHEALVLLGIASRHPDDWLPDDPYDRLLLEPWAVEAAFARRKRTLEDRDLSEIRRCTRDARSIPWLK